MDESLIIDNSVIVLIGFIRGVFSSNNILCIFINSLIFRFYKRIKKIEIIIKNLKSQKQNNKKLTIEEFII